MRNTTTTLTQRNVIELVLERNADPCVRGQGLEYDASQNREIPQYDDALVEFLVERTKVKLQAEGREDEWDEVIFSSKKPNMTTG